MDDRIDVDIRFAVYLLTSKNPQSEREPWFYDWWQIEDMEIVLFGPHKEYMLLRCRGASKSRDLANIMVWHGYQRNHIGDFRRCVWYSASESQLTQVYEYFKKNRYVNREASTKTAIQLYNGNKIYMRMASLKQSVSLRADAMAYDEEQSMDDQAYMDTIGIGIGGDGYKIHAGTTEVDTVLNINYNRLVSVGRVLERDIRMMSWTTEQEVLDTYKGWPQWKIDSQLYCKWVKPTGRVFPFVESRYVKDGVDGYIRRDMTDYYGIDPNPKNGHTLVGCQYLLHATGNTSNPYEDCIYFFYEFSTPDSFMFAQNLIKVTNDQTNKNSKKIELEMNGGGDEYLKIQRKVESTPGSLKVSHDGSMLIAVSWAEVNKMSRVIQVRKYKLIVSPECPNTYQHLVAATWNPKESKGKVKKGPDMHYHDAGIHAASRDAEYVGDFSTSDEYDTKEWYE